MNYKNVEVVKNEFVKGEIERIDAIDVLEKEFNMRSLDAEEIIEKWESEKQ